jgi:FKBP-type peptidyl-prolyl cis-trans isomerase
VKNFIYSFIIVTVFALISGCETGAQNSDEVKLETKKDSISYSIGTNISMSLADIKEEVDIDLIIRALRDGIEEKEPLLTQNEMMSILQEFSNRMMAVRNEKKTKEAAENKAAGEEFLKENKNNEGVIVTPSGLQYQILKEGDGARPTSQDRVKVHYRGTLIDGTEFDSSFKNGEPITFAVTGVIKGWTEALQLMNVGSKYKLFIPSELAYGENGSGPIGPNAVLIFEVELLGIEQ